ncbi:SpoIID/LytB domain-containing protein [Occultella glacieicola]|uniref:SpoIID/LytB domain-containing protein n=1 Tax=Occultella glacieicola TaxID=2518684 RepID=A0ABY2EBB9_9MICO|nr:SpoIID/LytB domain-containing protein [Occultella glacieicola]TDE96145.1 SpoIID/LytB domain-containing protein [Occultella glacieicola]
MTPPVPSQPDRFGRRRPSRWLAAVMTALFLVGLGAVNQPPAEAAVSITVDGRGFGHGIGMSQYGAAGRATAGQTYTQILAAYYPGTTVGSLADSQSIRVWIQGDTDRQTWVRGESGLSVRVGTASVALPTTIGGTVALWRLRLVSGALVIEASVNGTWRAPGVPGLSTLLNGATAAEFVAGDGTVQLVTSTYREYRGVVRAVRVPGSTTDLRTVVVSTYANYLPSVVTSEMPASWHIQALRAQAVAARTYARFDQASKAPSAWYDTCDTTSCQVFQGLADYTAAGALVRSYTHERTTRAVAETSGVVLLYGGSPAFTQFSASNGGYSLQGSRPYLAANPDPFDGYAPWRVTLTGAQITAAYPSIGVFRGLTFARDGRGAYGGRVTSATLTGSQGSVTITGAQFRSAFGLRSTLLTASVSGVPLSLPQRDWNGDQQPDLVARGPNGALYTYLSSGPATWHSRVAIGRGWQSMGVMTQVWNFSGTRTSEIIAIQPSTAQLFVYPGDGRGGWGTPRVMGRGWRGFDQFVGVQDWSGRGTAGLIVRQRSTGHLLYYAGNGSGGLTAGVRIGTGWNGMDMILAAGDWDGDGNVDLLARQARTGDLYLYRGSGRGAILSGSRIGNGWASMDALVGAADWDQDGTVDVLAREAGTGALWLYPSDGAGNFRPRQQVGHGWTGFDLVR